MPSVYYREPIFVEQLISPTDLHEFAITSRTPLVCPVKAEELPRVLEIKNDDKVIAAYLSARSIKATKGWTKRHTLEEYAKRENRRLVYVM